MLEGYAQINQVLLSVNSLEQWLALIVTLSGPFVMLGVMLHFYGIGLHKRQAKLFIVCNKPLNRVNPLCMVSAVIVPMIVFTVLVVLVS